MICSKCGKTIDDNAPFCGFCGAPTGAASDAAPQQTQNGMYQQQSPYGAAANPSGGGLNLSPNAINYIKLGFLGVIAITCILTLIASINVLAATGSLLKFNLLAAFKLPGFITFARVSAILCFSFSALAVGFTFLVKQPWKLLFVCAGISVVMFIFNFVLGGWVKAETPAPLIISAIVLLACASSMLSMIVRTVLKDFIGMFKK